MKITSKITLGAFLLLACGINTNALFANTVGDKVDHAIDKTKEVAEKAKDKTKDKAHDAKDKAKEIHHDAKDKAHKAVDKS